MDSIDNNCINNNSNIEYKSTTKAYNKEKYKIELRTKIEMDTYSYLGLKFITNKYSIRNSNILTILTKSNIFTFSLLTSNSFTNWYHTIVDNMGPEFQFEAFLIDNKISPCFSKTIVPESVILHIRESNICLTNNGKSPLKILKVLDIKDISQFSSIGNKFMLETVNNNNKNLYVLISDYSNEINFRLNHVIKESTRKNRKTYIKAMNDEIDEHFAKLYKHKQEECKQSNVQNWQYESQYNFQASSSNDEDSTVAINKDDVFHNNTESYLSLNNNSQNLIKSKSSFQTSYPATNSSVSINYNNEEDVTSDYNELADVLFQQQQKTHSINSNNENYQQLKLSYRSESINSALSKLENDLTDDYYDYQIPYSQRNGIKEIKFSPIVTINSKNMLDNNKVVFRKPPKNPPGSFKRNNSRALSELREKDIFATRSENTKSVNEKEFRFHDKNRPNSRVMNFLNKLPLSVTNADDNFENKINESSKNEFRNLDNLTQNMKNNCVQCKVCKRNLDGTIQYNNNSESKKNLSLERSSQNRNSEINDEFL